ncbi:MAG: sigma-70 family RNA polymerase sigma factor [Opitutaceae bacterium]|nr:sigma-70 family RNA polymerase sigma factor [Opitutaceae bacterium]
MPGPATVPQTPNDDTELMRRVQAGDEGALGALMQRWEAPLKALIARIVLNSSEAQELAQETFVRVWQQRARFRGEREFRPWVFSIAINLARNRLRWWRRRPTVELQEWSPVARTGGEGRQEGSHRLEAIERAAAVRDAIAALPVDLREAIVLSEFEAMSHAEIAVAVGATVKAVETRIYRAREKLRQTLALWL